jgi:sialate O-acetylesterase
VTNLTVYSNVDGVKTGVISTGNIEFCGSNYAPLNKQGIPGASNTAYDFGDAPITTDKVGHGSLQIHNFAEKQTIFSYNNFTAPVSSIGIGNAPGANPDWTFVNTAGEYTKAVLKVYAEF